MDTDTDRFLRDKNDQNKLDLSRFIRVYLCSSKVGWLNFPENWCRFVFDHGKKI